jgi:hypothetical protein
LGSNGVSPASRRGASLAERCQHFLSDSAFVFIVVIVSSVVVVVIVVIVIAVAVVVVVGVGVVVVADSRGCPS